MIRKINFEVNGNLIKSDLKKRHNTQGIFRQWGYCYG